MVGDDVGTWKVGRRRAIYRSRWVDLSLVQVEAPNAERWDHHVVHLSRVAVALITNDRDEVLMLWRYRFATDAWGYELPGGIIDGDEESAATAAREAGEECGWLPTGEPEHLISFEPIPGMVTSEMDVYHWRSAERIGEPTDTEEAGTVEWVSLKRATKLAKERKLLGSGTLVALLYFLASRAEG
ncbi:NUDIX hydrolase [Actinoalloteichus sp. GBA129-24]|uniref:NUDIX hydrolase n=1 Tax=Actinoalloteichus sp. GBA129-24 TaxID=1612551 RepID=UPI000950C64A|nr:NUDIX hydrolase [Actinoalloteichus sp. GBA129-24]